MKRVYILIFAVVLLLISGCTQLSQNIPRPSLPTFGQKEKVIAESRGLSVQFKENQPPLDEVLAGKNFRITLDITNNDPADISGTISLSDTPSDEFSSLKGKEQQSFSLPAAELIENKIIPSRETLSFGPFMYEESKIFPGMVTNFIAEISTNHKTIIPAQICLKSDSSQEARCPNRETITNLGQQAKYSPITATKIEKIVVPQENSLVNLNLKIFLKNTGKGRIDNDDQSLNSFNINLQGAQKLDCSRTSKISLKEGENVIVCNTDISLSDELFVQDLLEISFEYPYKIIETLGPIKVTKILPQ